LRGALANVVGDASIMDVIRREMFELLGSNNLNLLYNSATPTPHHDTTLEDIHVSYLDEHRQPTFTTPQQCGDDEACKAIQMKFVVGQDIHPDFDIGFDLGLNGLPLRLHVDGKIQFVLKWILHFGIGYHATDGFYLVADPGVPLVELGIDVTIPGFDSSGTLLILTAGARDNAASPTKVGVGCSLLPSSTVSNGVILFSDVVRHGVTGLFTPGCHGGALVNLDLTLTIAGWDGFPTILANLVANWTFPLGSGVVGSSPRVDLKNVRIDLKTFFEKILKPIADKVIILSRSLTPIVSRLIKYHPCAVR
jgi:hypothetical protein